MRKTLASLLACLILLTGCGGSSGEPSNPGTQSGVTQGSSQPASQGTESEDQASGPADSSSAASEKEEGSSSSSETSSEAKDALTSLEAPVGATGEEQEYVQKVNALLPKLLEFTAGMSSEASSEVTSDTSSDDTDATSSEMTMQEAVQSLERGIADILSQLAALPAPLRYVVVQEQFQASYDAMSALIDYEDELAALGETSITEETRLEAVEKMSNLADEAMDALEIAISLALAVSDGPSQVSSAS